MNEHEEKTLADLLKRSVGPVNGELNRDLWPRMLRRLEQQDGRQWFTAMSSVPWFDWALLAVLILGVAMFPRAIPIWLYHL